MKTVLVVDDTKNIRILLSTCLELEGYRVLTASNGKEALELFEKEKLDLAFLDIKMPELSGTEVLKRIRDQGIETPVIIITAFATVKNAIECTRMGAVAYLQKPFTADKILHVLEELKLKEQQEKEQLEHENLEAQVKKLVEERAFNKAVDLLKKAVCADPSKGETYKLLGDVYSIMGNEEMANKFHDAAKLFN